MQNSENHPYAAGRRFYENHVAPMIRERFPEYESRIAVGIAGEGSDCFGYDDLISRDHDFGTGVCLWVTEADFQNRSSNFLGLTSTSPYSSSRQLLKRP